MIPREVHQASLAVLLFVSSPALAQQCPTGTLSCAAGWCCPPGQGGRTDVCCNSNPQSRGCTTNGSCGSSGGGSGGGGATQCPSGTLSCAAGWCCPPGQGGRTDVCCNSNPRSSGCTTNGSCGSGSTGGGSGGFSGGGGGRTGGGSGAGGGGGRTGGGSGGGFGNPVYWGCSSGGGGSGLAVLGALVVFLCRPRRGLFAALLALFSLSCSTVEGLHAPAEQAIDSSAPTSSKGCGEETS